MTMQQKKSEKGKEVNERSSEDERMKGGALVGLSQPYLGCGWFLAKNKKRDRASDVRSDLICSHVYNQKGQPVSGKKSIKKVNL